MENKADASMTMWIIIGILILIISFIVMLSLNDAMSGEGGGLLALLGLG